MGKKTYKKWLTKDGLIKLSGWARSGLTDEQIAKNVGVSRSTLSRWKETYPDIRDSLNKEKEVVDYEVENALLKRALGTTIVEKTYTLTEIKDEVFAIENVPTMKKVQTAEYVKQLPPDVTAIQFWLRNRKPKQYRDQSYAKLNEAQADKAKIEAQVRQRELDKLNEKDTQRNKRVFIVDDF
jgi:transcriptional regulator with XRE-family HTH domain